MNAFCDSPANGWIGRELPGLLTGAGFADLAVSPQVLVSRELGPVEEVLVATIAGENAAWAADQRRRAADGTFLLSMTMFVVSARKGDA